ncbi:hypothetical protein BV898_00920 [Hypsibius exemplaris]|uniref:Uncharacterized protein n=1 Tax=Hypsibius exemplaris TaxID=2072580 RepID=A0A1W0XCN0_HYPEX|nr:hypothetical protein BV898_00920 [Hypsibius exemplaris]
MWCTRCRLPSSSVLLASGGRRSGTVRRPGLRVVARVEGMLICGLVLSFQFYQDPLTLAYPQECQDADMPDFYYRDASPSSDKENSHDLFIADFTKWSGPLFREPPPELAMPSSKNKSKGKKRKDKMPPDPMLGSKSSRRKKDQVSPMGLDSSGLGRLMRTPSHMGMLRDYSNMGGLDIPDSLATLENATADWKPFEDWQIVMTSAMLQGHPQNSQQTLPSMNNISCDLVSYVTSTANVRYRQGRDCQVRLKTLRMREDKDQIMEALPTPKKKKKKTEENLSVDKSLFPVPKRAVNSLQEDNGRARTQVYRDVFSSWRSQHYNPPNIQRRDVVSAQQRVGAGAWSNAVFQECHIVLDEPVNPLTMLKQRQEKANLPKTFITERTLRWAQTLNTTVDTQGQKVDFQAGASPLQPKSSVASILQQTLQQSGAGGSMMPRTSSGSGGGSMAQLATGPGGGMQQQPLPSPQFIAANPNQVRRQAQLPSTNSMTLTAPSSNPLPSLGSSVMNQYMTSNVTQQQPMANMTSGGPVHSGDSGAAMQHPLPQPPVQGPVTIKLTAQQQRAQQMQVLRQIFALPPNQTTYYQHDITRIKEFLANRGITFSDNQLADLARAFSTKNPPNATPGTVADGAGGGTATFQQLSPQPSQLVLSPQQQQQQQSPQQQPVPVTPLQIAPAPQVTVSGARPMVVNSRLPNVQSTGGQTTVRLNFVNQLGPQAPQAVRQQQTKPRPSMIAVKNGQAAAAPQVYAQPALAPAAAASSSQPQQPVAIQPNPVVRAGATVMSVSVPQLQQLRRMVVPGAQNMIDLSLVSGDMAAPRSLVANSAVINNINFSPVAIQQQLAMLQQNPQVGGGALKREPDSASPPAPGSGTVPEPS